MPRKLDWDSLIGKRLRLRDLHVFFTVIERGGMAKAAVHLGISQPAVSEVISNLERLVGVRLLDRSQKGVELTIYGRLLQSRGTAAFDELRQGIKDIEFQSGQAVGQVRVGCPESISASILPAIIENFNKQYPNIVLHITQIGTSTLDLPGLHERKFDVVIARHTPQPDDQLEDLHIEILFNDKLVLAVGNSNELARVKKVSLDVLARQRWILTPPGSLNYSSVEEIFKKHDLVMPKIWIFTHSIQIRTHMLATGYYVTAIPYSTLRLNVEQFNLIELPIALPERSWSVALVTLKNRTLSLAAELFMECVRETTKPIF